MSEKYDAHDASVSSGNPGKQANLRRASLRSSIIAEIEDALLHKEEFDIIPPFVARFHRDVLELSREPKLTELIVIYDCLNLIWRMNDLQKMFEDLLDGLKSLLDCVARRKKHAADRES